MTQFVCISGRARHGKDTSAQIVKRELSSRGYSVIVVHYADLLKHICKSFFDWDGEKDEKGRSLLQYIGTDCIRSRDQDYWVRFIAGVVSMFPNKWDYVVVADTRFPNEIQTLRDMGFRVHHLSVVRQGFDSELTSEQKNHSSENALADVLPDDFVCHTTLKELEIGVLSACDRIVNRYAPIQLTFFDEGEDVYEGN